MITVVHVVPIQVVRSVIKIFNFKADHASAWLTSTLQLKAFVSPVDQQYKDAQLAKTILQRLQPAQLVIVLGTILMQEFVKNAPNYVLNALDLRPVPIVKHPQLILLLTMELVFVTLDQIYT